MIAERNESIMEASKTLYDMHCEETIRDMARARQDAVRLENTYKRMIAELEAENTAQADKIAAQADKITVQADEIAVQADEIARQKAENAMLKAEIERLKNKQS